MKNIHKEVGLEFGIKKDFGSGDLTGWAKQGVFLLNSVLTVVGGEAASHKGAGWEKFTDLFIKTLIDNGQNLIFMLWGSFARSKKEFINNDKHCILKAAHPLPLSAHNGFFGCEYFLEANEYLKKTGQKPIDWQQGNLQQNANKLMKPKELGCDIYIFSSHKMYGPDGLGIMYAKKEILEKFNPQSKLGGGMVSFVSESEYKIAQIPWKWEAGTLNLSAIYSFSKCIDFWISILE